MLPFPSSSRTSTSEAPILRLRGLATRIGGKTLHRGVDLELYRGEVLAVVGASGEGKSVLLRTVVGLIPGAAGTIEAFGENLGELDSAGRRSIEGRWGVLFQDGALFSSLTVAENIEVPLEQQLDLPRPLMAQIAALKIALVGLPPDTATETSLSLLCTGATIVATIASGFDPVAHPLTIAMEVKSPATTTWLT